MTYRWMQPAALGPGLMRRLRLHAKLGLCGAVALIGITCSLLDAGHGGTWRTAALVCWALFAWWALSLAWTLSQSMAQLRSMLAAIEKGDLTQTLSVAGDDELAAIGRQVEAMSRLLSKMVARTRSEAQMVAMGGERLGRSARELSDRTESQASSLEQTNATLTELTSSVQRNAEQAQAADGLAAQVRGEAEQGLSVVEQSVDAILRIEQRSRQMGEIISVIDGIAFQTNILALNAAVEAARAGEQGRGFAVVAGEVRSLAQRSAQAAAEVKKLIQASGDEVQHGVASIRQASGSLGRAVQGMRELAGQVRDIAGSNSAQSTSLREIAAAIASLDDITQRNAQMVDRSVHGAERLHQQAMVLSAAVSDFRLRQGCAGEARSMVERAVRLIDEAGLPAARQRFHDRQGGFFDRDLFVLVVDRRNHFAAFGLAPDKAGKPAVAAPGTDVDELCRRVWQAAASGGDWVEFRAMHPVTKLIVDKIGYVLPAGGGQYAVLTSVNRGDGTEAAPGTAPAPTPAPVAVGAPLRLSAA
ncbi:methyl-accepting chemotaxis protein [Aquabacterium sp. J223]|uniref:methyl-accepting chemotaxis protein n=1 Tax=Aquabacterium sp. J223 TaxID=2898431 RepID=UPI0021AE0468|nr:methyl-accepting chemotaxis protein [Aquabacterium sp. J223]UUX94110.1 methyl-accepting chemotaxis protein [Aquabacterium sp. J223]